MKLYFYQLLLIIIIINVIGSIDNIEFSDRLEEDLYNNITTTYNFSNRYNFLNNPNVISSIDVVNKANELEILLWIEILKNASNSTKEIGIGKAYKYFNIFINTERMKNATIKYRINNTWIKDNKIDNVTLSIWKEENWNELDTKKINEDENYTYFQSETDKLSSFVITGLKDNRKIDNQSTISVKITENGELNSNIEEKKNTWYDTNTIILFAVLIVLIIFILRLKE